MRTRNFTKSQKPKEHFLVLCEGETEEEYVKLLRSHFRLPISIRIIVTGNAITSRLINQYIQEMKLAKNDKCHTFFIYDGDLPEVVSKLQRLEGRMVITTPCIELWFILHHLSCLKCVSSDETIKMLRQADHIWKNYVKGTLSVEQKRLLLENMQAARERSKKLSPRGNPSSDFPLLIDALEKVKNG